MSLNYSQTMSRAQAGINVTSLANEFADVDNLQPVSDLNIFFAEVRKLVDATLDEIVPANNIDPARLYEAIRWSLFGEGKRFRPALVIAVGRVFGASDEKLLRTAAAVEMIHTYSLIHDDLPAMDDDDLRRGRATAHKKFDEATAILAGDALQALAFEAIAHDDLLNSDVRLKLVAELSMAAGQMVAGQQLDLEAEGKPLSAAEIEDIHLKKTGALISFAARAGATIGGASDAEHMQIARYGLKLGLLFQMTDDILDITSSSEALGKTALKDVSSQKSTFPILLGIEESRRLTVTIRSEALAELDGLNKDTDLLRNIVDYVYSRQS